MSGPFIPVPYVVDVQLASWGSENELGEKPKVWSDPFQEPICGVYTPSSDEPFVVGQDRVAVDLCIIAPVGFPVGPHDRVIVGGKTFDAVGYPKDHTMGPHGWNPGVMLWTFKRVEQ